MVFTDGKRKLCPLARDFGSGESSATRQIFLVNRIYNEFRHKACACLLMTLTELTS